jgi:predicted permease
MGIGFFSRRMGILKSGDERVLSAYVYYFALPALFFVNMAETNFAEEIQFMIAGIVPVLMALLVHITLYLLFRFSRKTLYLLILSTVFGSLAFFGIPFIMFAFPEQGEHLSTLSAASIAIVSVTISITVLELHKLETATVWEGLKQVVRRLPRNPLILSIFSGILLSLIGVEIPSPVSTSLHMLGGTTSTVAVFMLGVFLYGRRYTNIVTAFGLSLLRMVFLPVVAFLSTMLFNLPEIERSTLILMHGMPIAISMIVLSERYDFHKETIASLILISSLGAGFYLNLWLFLLGYY